MDLSELLQKAKQSISDSKGQSLPTNADKKRKQLKLDLQIPSSYKKPVPSTSGAFNSFVVPYLLIYPLQ
jgi:hypothetical protein